MHCIIYQAVYQPPGNIAPLAMRAKEANGILKEKKNHINSK